MIEVDDWTAEASDNVVNIKNNNSDISDITVYAAAYTQDGVLANVKAVDKTVAKQTEAVIPLDFAETEYDYVKVFAWKKGTMEPVIQALKIK